MSTNSIPESNDLYPVFLKLDKLHVLIVGGGNVALEKIQSLLRTTPTARITLVAPVIKQEIQIIAQEYTNVYLLQKEFEPFDLEEKDVVLAATDNRELHKEIKTLAGKSNIKVNVADTPELCDFYLGSIVNKGGLKIAISTNGKSPTIAKRIKEVLIEAIPDEMEDVLNNLQQIRARLNGNFSSKVKQLNEITNILVEDRQKIIAEKRWKKLASRLVLAFALMVAGHIIITSLPLPSWSTILSFAREQLTGQFLFFVLAGFLAQLVDGSLGMGYGVTSATCLMTTGISPVSISAAIHTSEIFSSGISGYSHYKFGNINKKLFRHLVVPGVIGAVLGSAALVLLGEHAGKYLMPVLAAYVLFLGFKIFVKAFQAKPKNKKIKRVGWLAWTGGFLDSFGGGGWGPIVTSTLISKGKSPRLTIGTVSLTEFFVTLSSAITFFITAGVGHWSIVVGLLIGGSIAAPLSAKLVGKLPERTMKIGVGIIVMIWSVRLIVRSLGLF